MSNMIALDSLAKMNWLYILFALFFAINMIYLWWIGARVFLKEDYEDRIKRLKEQIKDIWRRKV